MLYNFLIFFFNKFQTFEDQEFQHMEQEAMWEAGREELSRELGDVMANIDERKATLMELEGQREEAAEAAYSHTELVERQLDTPLKQLEEGRFRLREIEAQLKEMSKEGLLPASAVPTNTIGDTSPENSSEAEDESYSSQMSPSKGLSPQELGERISQVTSQSPIDIKNGSLGRKTIESLKEIEKNRQLLLAKQGECLPFILTNLASFKWISFWSWVQCFVWYFSVSTKSYYQFIDP